ncbi:MAG: MATE family efflux transporter [Deltaproteobacteria bacterium]|nr:MATE family efflux transporter [Deltaproteobacteria bacterium]MBW1814527.1 MATE family efflux transporter [Deltaproteobacteria bacterium]
MSNNTHKFKYLLEMPVRKAVFHLAWPTILAVLLQNLATTVDLIMVGSLGSAEVAAVGFSAMIFWLLSSLIIGMEVSITAIVARAIGAGTPEKASRALGQAYIFGITTSILMIISVLFLAPHIFNLFGVEQDVFNLSVPYLRILCMCQLFMAIISASSGALRGAGDMRTPMVIGFAVNFLHIILNYMFILGRLGSPSFGINGAAMGTSISAFAGACFFLFLMFTERLKIGISLKDFQLDIERLWKVIRLAVPAAMEMIVLQLGLLIYAKFIVAFGTTVLSGYQVGMHVLSLSFIPNTGFGMAASTLVGQNLGANRTADAKKTGWICMFWGMTLMMLMGIIFFSFAKQIASVFVSDPDVIKVAVDFIRAVAICQGGMAIYFTLAGALRGAGDTRSPLLITLLGMYAFRIPAAWIVTDILELEVRFAFMLLILDYIVRDIAILTRYARGKWIETKV